MAKSEFKMSKYLCGYILQHYTSLQATDAKLKQSLR
jgi:hypothetical protein